MNIAIDVQPLYSTHMNRGIGNYVKCQLKNIFQLDKVNKYFLINHYGPAMTKEVLMYGDNVIELNFYDKSKNYLTEYGCAEISDYFRIATAEIIEKYCIDLFHITAAVDQFEVYDPKWFKDTKIIVNLYDLIPLIFSKHYLCAGEYPIKYSKCLDIYLYADLILTDSQSAKNDALQYIKIAEKRVSVIYSGVDERYIKQVFPQKIVQSVKEKYGIYDKYIICVGADDFRKNLNGLVQAYCLLPKTIIEDFQLVIVCAIRENVKNEFLDFARACDCDGKLVITGFVSDEDMLCLLNNAYLAAFPSMYEGFGLPVVEAWTCGIPVLTSNNSSLGEIATDVAITVNPFSVDSIKAGLEYALTTEDLNKYIEKGFYAVEKYSWNVVAGRTIEAYNRVYNEPKMIMNDKMIKAGEKLIRRETLKYVPRTNKKIITKLNIYYFHTFFSTWRYEGFLMACKKAKHKLCSKS